MNNTAKYFTAEDNLQIAVCQYLRLQYPKAVFHHSPNEGKRSFTAQAKIKAMGVRAGFPDLIIFSHQRALALELKTEKGKSTPAQNEWLDFLLKQGWSAGVAFGFDEAKSMIDQFMKRSAN